MESAFTGLTFKDAKIALSDYIEIQLLRTGAVDRETLDRRFWRTTHLTQSTVNTAHAGGWLREGGFRLRRLK